MTRKAERHDADAGEVLARKVAARLVGVDDGVRRRQFMAGQVVVGNQHLQACGLGRGHAFDATLTLERREITGRALAWALAICEGRMISMKQLTSPVWQVGPAGRCSSPLRA